MNHLAILQILVEKGANIEKMGRFATIGTPLHVACHHGHAHAVNLLIELGADRNARDETAFTPLHVACRAGQYDVAFMLVDLEADRTARADNNKLAFDYVAVPTIKEKLIILAAKVDARIEARLAEERRLAAIEAERLRLEAERLERLRLEELERIRQAILRTANFTKALRSVADISGEMSALLGVAEQYPDQDINVNIIVPVAHYSDERFQITESIDYDMDSMTGTVHSHTTVGTTYEVYQLINTLHDSSALTRAALRGFSEVVHALLQWPGININYQDSSGNTALHNAALIGNREIVEELLLAGINLTVLNNDGKVAANVAKTNYLREIIRNPALISNRVKYQNRVLDHLFIQYKCREGMDLNISEANKVNRFLEYDPKGTTSDNNNTLAITNGENTPHTNTINTTSTTIPQLTLTDTHTKSKYYRSPSKVKSKLMQHTQSQHTLNTTPLVIFTPDNVPPALGHLFPNDSMVIPAYSISSEDLPHSVNSAHNTTSEQNNSVHSHHTQPRTYPPNAHATYNTHTTHNTATTQPLLPEVANKYGPVPGAFGGSVGDFFFRTLNIHSTAHIATNNSTNNANNVNTITTSGSRNSIHTNASSAHFLDLLTLQRGYTPTAFDTTPEWNEVKDYLWLLSYPCRSKDKNSSAPYSVHDNNAIEQSMYTATSSVTHAEHSTTYSTNTIPNTTTTTTNPDRRQFLYKIAVTMNEIQCTFTDTEIFTVFSNPPSGPNSPLKESEKLPLLTPGKHNSSAGSVSNGVNSSGVLHSPVAHIKKMLSIEAQHAPNNTLTHTIDTTHALDTDIDYTRIPLNISRTDARRLATFAKQCELFVLLVLQLYEPREYPWPNPMYDNNTNQYISQAVRDNVAYMRYWGLVSADIEAHLTTLVDLGFTACFIDPREGENASSRSVNDHKRVNFADETHPESQNDTSSAVAKRRMPDLFVNPPRYWRLAVDSVYEVCTFIKQKAELGYPLDTVRAHLWAHMGRQTIQVQRAAVNQLYAHTSNANTATTVNPTTALTTAALSKLTLDIVPHTPHNASEPISPNPAGAADSISPSVRAYRRWLKELMLVDYELYFQHQGFQCLSDFVGLTEQDCTEYFPFLKVRICGITGNSE